MAYELTLQEQSLMGFLIEHGKTSMNWADEDCESCHGFGFHVYQDSDDPDDCHEEPCECYERNRESEDAQNQDDRNVEWLDDPLPWEVD